MADVMKTGFTAGSSDRMNRIIGVAGIMRLTEAEVADETMMRSIFPSGVLVKFPASTGCTHHDGIVIMSDGRKTLAQLKEAPLVDEALLHREKVALDLTFGGDGKGDYAPVEGGLLLLKADGKMESYSMPANIWSEDDQKILLSALPDTVRAGITYVPNIAARDALDVDGEAPRGLVYVINAAGEMVEQAGMTVDELKDDQEGNYIYTDAAGDEQKISKERVQLIEEAGVMKVYFRDATVAGVLGDPTVNNGAALYSWDATDSAWKKIAEVESLDIDVNALAPTYKSVQEAGAAMYDHSIEINVPTLTEILKLEDGDIYFGPAPTINAPGLVGAPAGGYSVVSGEDLTIESTPFQSSSASDRHVATEWILSSDPEGTDVIETVRLEA